MINVFDDVAFQYGKLLKITSAPLIERYNRALQALINKTTPLQTFHIDCTGFSPEIAAELGDDDYLNAHGVNKKFILISMDQHEADMAKTHFSSTMHMVKRFFKDNKKSLTTLTAGDVVFGEMDNKQFRVSSVTDMLKANKIFITVDTSRQLLEKSELCAQKIETMMEGDNWQNDDVLNEIIELSKTCGNVLKNSAIPTTLEYQRGHYYTSLFGGMYVFQQGNKTTIITQDPLFNGNDIELPNVETISCHSEKHVFTFLEDNNLIKPLSPEHLQTKLDELELKQLHSVLDLYLKQSKIENFAYLDKNALRRFIVEEYEHLPKDFYRLERLVSALRNDRIQDINVKEYKPYFFQVNSDLSGADYALVSHLLSRFKPYSYLHTFIYNRRFFEQKFKKWTPAKQNYVKTYLYDHSQILNGLRERIDVE